MLNNFDKKTIQSENDEWIYLHEQFILYSNNIMISSFGKLVYPLRNTSCRIKFQKDQI